MNALNPIGKARSFVPVLETQSDQRTKLDMLAHWATSPAAREAADRGDLFASVGGLGLVNAIHDLTEIDAVYDLAADVSREIDRG